MEASTDLLVTMLTNTTGQGPFLETNPSAYILRA
jgi:hypothetical protein